MTKLSDTQAVILCAAAQREDRNVLPLTGSASSGGAAGKVVGALLKRGLIAETTTDSRTKADPPSTGLAATTRTARHPPAHHDAGLAAMASSRRAPTARLRAPTSAGCGDPQDAPAEADPASKARTPRTGTKQAKLIAMLRAEGGATIDEMAAATGWAAHSIRGVLSGTLKKKLGLAVTSEKVEGRGRLYALPASLNPVPASTCPDRGPNATAPGRRPRRRAGIPPAPNAEADHAGITHHTRQACRSLHPRSEPHRQRRRIDRNP
jgi:hypothetical protein